MPMFRLPLSGNVTQSILPWNWFFQPVGGQFGLFNIQLGQSSNPAVEQEVLNDVAGYGKQLGRVEEALMALIDAYQTKRAFTEKEEASIVDLKAMMNEIAKVKKRHDRPAEAVSAVPRISSAA